MLDYVHVINFRIIIIIIIIINGPSERAYTSCDINKPLSQINDLCVFSGNW